MPEKEKILRPIKRIKGGCFLPHLKNTAELETVDISPVDTVFIPFSQHIGAPAKAVVKKGDEVKIGTLIGEAAGAVSSPIHASVSGEVTAVNEKGIEIKSDGKMTVDENLSPVNVKTPQELAAAARDCGLVGLGGAGFPTDVKLNVKKGHIKTLIVNGAECEPYITSDYRECMDNYEDVIEGVYLIKKVLGIKRVVICIEGNKKKALKKLFEIAADKRDVKNRVRLMRLPVKYPQGAEKVIIYSATGKKLAPGKLPSDIGCLVMNITSIGTLYRYIKTGMPLVSKRITVDGTAVSEPKNVNVPIGTSIKTLLEFVGVDLEQVGKVLMGGPMMGIAIDDIERGIEKRNNGITVMKKQVKAERITPCIKCGRCAVNCPMRLYPTMVEAAIKLDDIDRIKNLNVNYCMECGCCSYVCPARRPLTQTMRIAKAKLKGEKK
ncbi:MAG: electron transport complex subunit RsxC [Clostridia bacterium]|nr:electron transport complex subunit RsxC [Clostridia bacterium]